MAKRLNLQDQFFGMVHGMEALRKRALYSVCRPLTPMPPGFESPTPPTPQMTGGAAAATTTTGEEEEDPSTPEPSDQESEGEEEEEEKEPGWFDRFMPLIENHTYVAKTNANHIYVNFNAIGQILTTKLIMGHLREILSAYSKIDQAIYVQPQIGFFLYDTEGKRIKKRFYESSNTAIFPYYRLLSHKNLSNLEKFVKSLAVKNFPFRVKINAEENSILGVTLISNIMYSVLLL